MLAPILFGSIIDTVAFWGIVILIVCGIIGVVYIILGVLKVAPPAWLVNILWVILAVIIGVIAIGFLASLGGAQPETWLRVN